MALLQSLPGSVQFADYSTTTAGTSHAVTITTANLTIRNSMILGISYDGATGGQVSGITDTDGNTWAKATSGTNSTQTNGEFWYCTNLAGGTKPTVTVALSSSVKATIILVEVTGIISYKTPLDVATARVYTTLGVGKFGTATGARNGAVEAIFQFGMANNTSLTWRTDAGVSGFNGANANLHTYKDATTGLSVIYGNCNAESFTLASKSPGFQIAVSSSIPVVILCATFYRQGVSQSTAESGSIINVEGSQTVDQLSGVLIKTSATAPTGGTGGSTDTKVYGFIPGLDLPAGVTVSAAQLNWLMAGGTDDGLSDGYSVRIDPTAPIGTTLETTDENGVGGSIVASGLFDITVTYYTATLAPSDVSTTTTYMNTMYFLDTSAINSSAWEIGLRLNNVPDFVEAILSWPGGGTPRSFGTIIG